jgi:hypothetical protein
MKPNRLIIHAALVLGFSTLVVFSISYSFIFLAPQVGLELYGVVGDVYRIDYTDDLGTNNWRPFGNIATEGTLSDFANLPMRFYRAVPAPPGP